MIHIVLFVVFATSMAFTIWKIMDLKYTKITRSNLIRGLYYCGFSIILSLVPFLLYVYGKIETPALILCSYNFVLIFCFAYGLYGMYKIEKEFVFPELNLQPIIRKRKEIPKRKVFSKPYIIVDNTKTILPRN